MRYLLLLAPLGFLLSSCGSRQSSFRDYDGSYSWSNSEAYREGYQSGYQKGYQEGADDQAAESAEADRSERTTRTRTVVRYEYYPTFYYHWSQPWMGYPAHRYYGGWNNPYRWNRGYGWNNPWYGGYGWNDPWYGGYGWNDPWYGGYYGYNGYYGYGGYWGNPYYRRYDRWNRPGGGWTQPGGGNGGGGNGGGVDPTPTDGLRREQINGSSTPYRRPVVTNNPGGGSVSGQRPSTTQSERTPESTPSRPTSGNLPGTVSEDQPSRPNLPASRTAPQAPASRQPEARPTPPSEPSVRKPPAAREPEARGGFESRPSAPQQPRMQRGGFESRPSAPQPSVQRTSPSSQPSMQRSSPAPGVRRP